LELAFFAIFGRAFRMGFLGVIDILERLFKQLGERFPGFSVVWEPTRSACNCSSFLINPRLHVADDLQTDALRILETA
jgi:hypothetical protein